MSKIIWTRAVSRDLLPLLPGFSARQRLVYLERPSKVLCGVNISVSGFGGCAVYPECFALPLYVVQEVLSLDISERLRHPHTASEMWNIPDESSFEDLAESIRKEGMLFFSRFQDPQRLINELTTTYGDLLAVNPYFIEMLAYSEVDVGDADQARKHILELIALAQSSRRDYTAMIKNASLLAEDLSSGELGRAQIRLEAWQQVSLSNLKLAQN